MLREVDFQIKNISNYSKKKTKFKKKLKKIKNYKIQFNQKIQQVKGYNFEKIINICKQ